ncbi:MAG: RDD family protein [Paludibacteraceae bacterium]|nr:RDD family protein [Paludibacteraceae bacterium]
MNATVDIHTGEYVTLNFKKATGGSRILAVVIDWLLFFAIGILLIYIRVPDDVGYFYLALIPFFNLFFEYLTKGRTIGKYVLGIKVINDQCTPPSFLQCFLRWVLFPIDFWLVGIINIANKGQRFGDMASGCQCIKSKDVLNADLSRAYKYTNENYKVRFVEARNIDAEVMAQVEAYVFGKSYDLSRDKLVTSLKKTLNINHKISDYDFLFQVYNDYKYLTEVK